MRVCVYSTTCSVHINGLIKHSFVHSEIEDLKVYIYSLNIYKLKRESDSIYLAVKLS